MNEASRIVPADDDGLNPARGVRLSLGLGLIGWAALVLAAWPVVRWIG